MLTQVVKNVILLSCQTQDPKSSEIATEASLEAGRKRDMSAVLRGVGAVLASPLLPLFLPLIIRSCQSTLEGEENQRSTRTRADESNPVQLLCSSSRTNHEVAFTRFHGFRKQVIQLQAHVH